MERLRKEFLIDFTYNSNAIEGNTLTLKDHLEAVGHRDAFLYVQDISTKNIPLDESVIKNIHSLVLMHRPEDKGVYRRIPVRIIEAYTELVQPYLIEPKIVELLTENEKRKGMMSPISGSPDFIWNSRVVIPSSTAMDGQAVCS